MDRSGAEELLRQAGEYRVVRPATWQGELARSGPAYNTASGAEARSHDMPPAPKPSPLQAQSQSLWHVLEAAAGGGQKGKLVSRLMQKHLLARVDALPIDEIEGMAGGQTLGQRAR